MVAPTGPVLATAVPVRHIDDFDQVRFALTSEAGMNDASGLTFVMPGLSLLDLHDPGDADWRRLAIGAGIGISILAVFSVAWPCAARN